MSDLRSSAAAVAPASPFVVRRRAELAVVEEHRKAMRARVAITILAGVFIALFAVAGSATHIVGQQRHLDSINRDIANEQDLSQKLGAQLAELQSPVRVTRDAAAILGMIPAPTPVYLEPRADDDARAAEVPPASTAAVR
ncbi:MAG: hypothetical protein F2520_02270 [Actinobacteria bacterium]|nr:hypothetical protein [Actinomycetota bacterium]MTA77070.1 hypothetical protein [Actinomycetota bacterium]